MIASMDSVSQGSEDEVGGGCPVSSLKLLSDAQQALNSYTLTNIGKLRRTLHSNIRHHLSTSRSHLTNPHNSATHLRKSGSTQKTHRQKLNSVSSMRDADETMQSSCRMMSSNMGGLSSCSSWNEENNTQHRRPMTGKLERKHQKRLLEYQKKRRQGSKLTEREMFSPDNEELKLDKFERQCQTPRKQQGNIFYRSKMNKKRQTPSENHLEVK